MNNLKPIGIGQVDSAVLKAMVTQGRLNIAAKADGAREVYCCACRSLVREPGAKAGKDLPNSRRKVLEDKWTSTADLSAKNWHKWVVVAICEPCNYAYFTPEGVAGIPYNGPTN